MGTSSLICVFYNSEFVIVQFVLCDGFPEGQGVEILKFLLCPGNIGSLKNGLQHTYTIDENDPRGRTGAKFLDYVAKATAENRTPVQLTLWFANDLGYVWAYVVDLDDGLFEVYHGSQYKSQATSKQFNSIGGQDGIVPDLVKSFLFIKLPTEVEFIAAFVPSYEKSDEMTSTQPEALPGETTYGPAQDDSSDYMTEDSVGDDTSVYTQSNDASDALGETTYKAVLETAKCALVDQLMQEVWVRFDKDWTEKFTSCAGSETTSAQKRRRGEDDDNSSSDDHCRAPKRSIPQPTLPGGEGLALSCPFRKHDPRKYYFPEYKTCALSFWKNVGRVK